MREALNAMKGVFEEASVHDVVVLLWQSSRVEIVRQVSFVEHVFGDASLPDLLAFAASEPKLLRTDLSLNDILSIVTSLQKNDSALTNDWDGSCYSMAGNVSKNSVSVASLQRQN